MALANTGYTPGLSKHSAFGFALQTEAGTEAIGTINWIPVDGTVDFRHRANRTFHRQVDYVDGEHLVYSAGQWAQGGLGFILQPDATVLADLMSWIMDRDDHNQGAVATVYKFFRWGSTTRIECWIDCKVEEAKISLDKGKPLGLALSVVGRKPGVWTGTPTMIPGAPLLWKETKAEISMGGETLAITRDLESANISINNDLEGPGEGLRICYDDDGGKYPKVIYNKGAAIVTGSVTRDFLDDDLGEAFISQVNDDFGDTYDGQLKFTVARGGHGFMLQCNRVQWLDGADGPDFPGSNDARLSLGVDWHSLMTDDGLTAAIEYSVV
ncbi:MAG: phage tail tube protein [Armatimonadota bacterium]